MNDAPKTSTPEIKVPVEIPEPKENIVKPAPVTPTTAAADKK